MEPISEILAREKFCPFGINGGRCAGAGCHGWRWLTVDEEAVYAMDVCSKELRRSNPDAPCGPGICHACSFRMGICQRLEPSGGLLQPI